MNLSVSPIRKFSGRLTVPGDKSISHRAVMLAALAEGKSEIRNFLSAEDCLRTLNAFQKMGIRARFSGKDRLVIEGKGLRGLRPSPSAIDLGNSGTSMRLLAGILAGQFFQSTLKGDASLSRRPMQRIILPLEKMGATIQARRGEFPPLRIQGGRLRAIRYAIPVPSAQVKSAILLATFFAEGKTELIEPFKTRDHTEQMLKNFGVSVRSLGRTVFFEGGQSFEGSAVDIPGDISSAAFFVVLAACLEKSNLIVKNVGLNPTRLGFIRVLKRMGADIQIERTSSPSPGEPFGEIRVKGSRLKGAAISADEVPGLIDELPILMVAASRSKGRSFFRGLSELRVKETDRIHSMVVNLQKMGVAIRSSRNDVVIEGGRPFFGGTVESFKDHRTAMSLAVAGRLAEKGRTVIRDVSCIRTSFPGFINLI